MENELLNLISITQKISANTRNPDAIKKLAIEARNNLMGVLRAHKNPVTRKQAEEAFSRLGEGVI